MYMTDIVKILWKLLHFTFVNVANINNLVLHIEIYGVAKDMWDPLIIF